MCPRVTLHTDHLVGSSLGSETGSAVCSVSMWRGLASGIRAVPGTALGPAVTSCGSGVQNCRMGEVGRDYSGASGPTSWVKQSHPTAWNWK